MSFGLEATIVEQATAWWWSTIAPLAAQALILVPLVALVDRLLPRRSWPQLRAAMWLFVMARLVLPPALLSPALLSPTLLPLLGPETWHPMSVFPTTTLPNTILHAEHQPVVLWATLAVAVWLTGALTLAIAGGLWHRRATAAWRRGSTTEAPAGFHNVLAGCGQRLGLSRLPIVRFGPAIGSPFVAGILRPTIYLPDDLVESLSDEQLEHVLLHELAHIRRRDTLIAAGCAAITTAYWFHPCVWWAQWRLRALREQCCDQTVAKALDHHVENYRRTLLFFAAQRFEPAAGGLAFLRPESLLILRLRLLEDRFGRPWLRRVTTVAVLFALLMISLPTAHAADRTAAAVGEVIERPPGCLTLRYLVLKRLAEEQAAAADSPEEATDD